MKQTATIQEFLYDLFDEAQGEMRDEVSAEEYDQRRFDFAFHLTDGKADLERLVHILNNPDEKSPDEVSTELMGILYHIIPHLKTAGRLLLDDVPDPFESSFASK